MERELNPYNPGAGLRPPSLTGRDAEIESFDAIVARTRLRLPNRGMVLSGLRGVGKTVLLNALRDRADQMGWLTSSIEGQSSERGAETVRRRLAREFLGAARKFNRPGITTRMKEALGSVSSFSAKVGLTAIELEFGTATNRANSGDLETDLNELTEDLSAAMAETKTGFALFVDEMQDLEPDTLAALVTAQHLAGQRQRAFYIIGAGLPNLPRALSEARSYAERLFDYRTIGPLAPADAVAALTEPAGRYGARYAPGAAELLAETAEGYPYFLQEFGRAIWDIAPQTPFTLDDAEAAIDYGMSRLDDGFFRARWDRATQAERRFLRAMAADDGRPSATRVVATRLGKSLKGIGPVRGALIDKGLIYAPEHGYVMYTVPGMAAYTKRQATN